MKGTEGKWLYGFDWTGLEGSLREAEQGKGKASWLVWLVIAVWPSDSLPLWLSARPVWQVHHLPILDSSGLIYSILEPLALRNRACRLLSSPDL